MAQYEASWRDTCLRSTVGFNATRYGFVFRDGTVPTLVAAMCFDSPGWTH